MWHFCTFSKTKINVANIKKGPEQSSCPANYNLTSDWNRAGVDLQPQLQLYRRESSGADSQRDFDYDLFETCSIFEHFHVILFKSPGDILFWEYLIV